MSTLILSFPETKETAKKTAQALKAEYSEIVSKKFPDSESYIKLKASPKDKTVVLISSIAKDVNNKLIDTILAAQAARENGAKKVILLATYLPYMRQDKHFNFHEVISAKKILTTLSENFDEIIAIDPHLHRIKSLSQIAKNARSISMNKTIAEYVSKHFNDYKLVGPDEESKQWDSLIAKSLHRDAEVLKKHRFSSYKVKITSKNLGDKVLIIDDIISTGKTLLETIKIAKKHGAKKVACIGIHGVFANNSDKILAKQCNLITSNTIPNKFAKIDISPLIISELRKIL